jgi:preprotein translocase subunit SecF
MIFLTMIFEPKMAASAIVAVVHDVFITVGIYALVGFDVTPATVIGFLTILGYSLYDTVVVFDKIRENTKSVAAVGKFTYSQAANLAVNQTIVRSANTSLIALLPVGAILFVGAGLLGAGTLKDLSLALFIGLAVGTYSSIFIAPPFLASLREKEPAMQALAKRVASRGGAEPVAVSSSANNERAAIRPSVGRGPRNQPKRKGRK